MVCGSWRSHRATPSITPPASWGESRALVTRSSETGRGAHGSPTQQRREAGPGPSLCRVSTKGRAHRPWGHRLSAHRPWGLGCPLPRVCFAPLVFQMPQAGFGTEDWGLIQTLPPSTTGDCETGCQMRLRHLVFHKHFFSIKRVPNAPGTHSRQKSTRCSLEWKCN